MKNPCKLIVNGLRVSILLLACTHAALAAPALLLGTAQAKPGHSAPLPLHYQGRGSGVVGVQWTLSFDGTRLSANISDCGRSLQDAQVTCANPGPGRIVVTGFSPSLGEIGDGSLGAIRLHVDPAVQGPLILPITITQSILGDVQGNSLASVGAVNGTFTVLSGAQAAFSVNSQSGAAIDFGRYSIGTTSPAKTITLTNSGSAGSKLAILAVHLTGADPQSFHYNNACQGRPLNANASCTIAVKFQPKTAALQSAILRIDTRLGRHTIGLSGKGQTALLSKPIPALKPWGLIAMISLLLLMGLLATVQHRQA